ncbi:MAG: prepilin-type N-terminal cleavage/methylation domain-containing protein [Nitrospirota bacterium]
MKYSEDRVKSGGFTLIEIMVTLVVFSFFVVGVYEVYNNVHDTWQSQSLKASTQQAERATLNYMQRDLMMAGYRSAAYVNADGSPTSKTAADKIVLANQSTICFDKYIDTPLTDTGTHSNNRLIEYSYRNGTLYRDVYTQYDSAHSVPCTPDAINYVPHQVVSSNISTLKFQYYKLDNSAFGPSDLYPGNLMVTTPPVIARIHVIIVQQSEKMDPRTKKYYYVTNDISVSPVNMRTSETVSDHTAPNIPTGLNVVDSESCSGTLECKWTANTEPDLAGYVVSWSRDPTYFEGQQMVAVTSLADPNHPACNINNLVITQAHPAIPGTVNTYYVVIQAYDFSGNISSFSPAVSGNPNPSITAFGGSNDTTINIPLPLHGPANFQAFNILDDSSVGQNQVKLTWNSSTDATQGYRLYRIPASSSFTYPIPSSYLIADETTLTSGVTSYIDKDSTLVTCQNYTYALCSVNCDPTLVQDYISAQFSTVVKDPTNTEATTPPDITGTRPGWRRVFINLRAPNRTGYDSDYEYTMIYYNEGNTYPVVDTNPNSPTYGNLLSGSAIPNTDCGVPGRFQTPGTVPTIIFSDPLIPAKDPPDLDNGQNYSLLAVSYYKCRGLKTATDVSQTLTTLCGDDSDFPGAPTIKDASNNYYLSVTTGGGCIYSPYGTSTEYQMPITLNWVYSQQNVIYDYAGLYIYKKNHNSSTWTYMTGPVWTGPVYDDNWVPGNQYDYMFKLADCAYVNSSDIAKVTACGPGTPDVVPSIGPPAYGYACDITPDSDALVVSAVAPGDLQEQTGGAVTTFGTSTSINGSFYHNAVKFNINNTANCNMAITSLDNIIWDNPAAYLKSVTIGPSADGLTSSYYQSLSLGSSILLTGGLQRSATVNLTTPAVLEGCGVNAPSPSNPIPITLEFETGAGTVDDSVDMRDASITLNAEYTNNSTKETTCARNGSIHVSLGPSVIGVAQNLPTNPTTAYDVPGASGTDTAPDIVVNGGVKINVSNSVLSNTFRNSSSIPMSTVKLYYRTTDQGTANPPAQTGPTDPAWTCLPMMLSSGSSNLYTLLNGTDNRLPISEGDRVWYYVVANDADGNFDRAPEPQNGYYTYDQKQFSVCDKTPNAPTLSFTQSGSSVTLNWTLPGGGSSGTYTDGSTIGAVVPDPITYDVYRKIGTGLWAIPTGAGNLSARTWTDPSVTVSTDYEVVAKNSCSSPGPNISANSNPAVICVGGGLTRVDLVPASVLITSNWSTNTGNKVPVNFDVFKCSRAGNGIFGETITVTVKSTSGPSQDITLTEDGDTGTFYLNGAAHTPMQITSQGSTGSGVQVATIKTSLADTVTFTDDNTGTAASLAVVTDPACNTPAQVTGVAKSGTTGNGANVKQVIVWSAVTKNTDGSTMDAVNDPITYWIYIQEPSQSPVFLTSVSSSTLTYNIANGKNNNSPYPAGSKVLIQAVDSAGNKGAQSTAVGFN